nr:MAG TPA: hypothetical protein [Caudoviricetes sp.]
MNQYTLKRTIAQPTGQRGKWLEVDILNMTLRDIAKAYSKAYFFIHTSIFNKVITVDLETYRSDFERSDITFANFLKINSNITLKESKNKVDIADRKARYADAWRAGYKITPVPKVASPDADLSLADKPNLLLEKKRSTKEESVDPLDYYKHCLSIVNGYIHMTDASKDGIYIIDGMKTILKSKDNQVGLISFKELGKLTIIPIKKDMIYTQIDKGSLYDQCYVSLFTKEEVEKYNKAIKDNPNAKWTKPIPSTKGKTIILVLGGYLHIQDWLSFRRISDTAIRIDFKNIPLFPRYHESKRFIDFSDAPLEKGYDDDGVAIGDLTSNDFLKYYLTIPQSFIAILDNEDIYVERKNVVTPRLPKLLVSHIEPTQPLIHGHGRIGHYWKIEERSNHWHTVDPITGEDTYDDTEYALYLSDNQYHNWGYWSSDYYESFNAVTNSRDTQEPTEHSQGYLLEIGSMLSKT